ncbi:MAG TPA: alpha/beta hydrolase [Dehalococcoidia bacterium]
MKTHAGIRFAATPDVDPNLQSLDIYAPDRGANLPVLLFAHGGSWASGDKGNVGAKAEGFTAAGYVFASTNYRLLPAAFPAHAEDVGSAIGWLKSHAREYGGDPDRIFIAGHSSGAHLVSLIATDERYLARHGLGLNAVRGIASVDTLMYDITSVIESLEVSESQVYRRVFGSEADSWRFASPAAYVEPGKGIPPTLIAFSGTNVPSNPDIRRQCAQGYINTLTKAGISTELVPAPEKTHGQINADLGADGDRVTQAILSFFGRHGGADGVSKATKSTELRL